MNPPENRLTGTAVAPTPADLLRGAALYLRRHGWIQDDYYRPASGRAAAPPACAVGAIAMAAYGQPVDAPSLHTEPEVKDFHRAVDALDGYLQDTYAADLYTWNDTPGRTADQVITALQAAAGRRDRAHTAGAGDNPA